MADKLAQFIDNINERVKENRKIPRKSPHQLPLWRDSHRGMPNSLARCALFTCANHRSPRAEFKRAKIASVSGYDIFYTGTELRQDDEDVLLQIVHIARMHPLGDVVEISGNALLRALGWNASKDYYAKLRDSIERLKEGTVKISQNDREGYAGSLIRKFAWKTEGESSTKWKIYLEKEIIALFADETYTILYWADRLKLRPLAKWMHSFYGTHKTPLPYKVETIHGLCGSKAKDMSSFRRDLKNALDELVDIGFLVEWKHYQDSDTIRVTRNHARDALLA